MSVGEDILAYYDVHKRNLPWRHDRNPYSIWISEIMCQQTRVDTVIPYFLRFMEKYPTILSLADAKDDELMKMWEGLGYYSRARNLKKAAILMKEKYQGKFPENYEDVLSLPGIGEYTASAILSMAFDEPYASIDGNFFRVFSRYYGWSNDIAEEKTKKFFKEEIEKILPSRSGDFNQAVMDIGATVCVPNDFPHCEDCPLKELCFAHREKKELDYPVNSRVTKVTEKEYTLFIIHAQGKYVLSRRPENGLLAGLYQFPNVPEKLSLKQVKQRFDGGKVRKEEGKTHHFSHLTWKMVPYVINLEGYSLQEGEFLASKEEILTLYSMPKAFHQFLDLLK